MSTDDTPTLREVLDTGQDPSVFHSDVDDLLGHAQDALDFDEGRRHEWAQRKRQAAAGLPVPVVTGMPADIAALIKTNHVRPLDSAWEAELYEDPMLALRLLTSLGDPQRDAQLAHHVGRRSPHPLDRHTPAQRWSCAHCGTTHDADAAACIEVSHREGYSETLPYPIRYCLECVAFAVGTPGCDKGH
jgi:hypothetical protein